MILVNNFHKAYDGTTAVAGLTFRVEPGQVLGLVGPNGAGKTTTLRALAGIISPSRGRLQVAGYELGKQSLEAKSNTAYIPDDPQLFHDLTVSQHMSFTAAAYRVGNAAGKVARLLDEFDLTQRLHSPAGELSRGMRQKLAICCGYLHDPRVILFDEPMTGLDPHGIRKLKESIAERAQKGAAIVVSSHLLAMVEDMCSHVLVLDAGRPRFCGPIGELRCQFAQDEHDVSLEDIFFRATDINGVHPERHDALTAMSVGMYDSQ